MVEVDYTKEFYEEIKPNYEEFNNRLPEYWELTYRDRWRTIRYELPNETGKLLDIGAGMGRAMKYFKDFGFNVFGIEPSPLAISKSPFPEKIIEGYFEDTYFVKDMFDVVYIEQVLSHTKNYLEILKGAYKVLKENGFIILEEPNDGNELQHEIVHQGLAKPDYWRVMDHVTYGGHEFYRDALLECGFKMFSIQSTWPMEWFELSGDHYLGDDSLGSIVHEKRYKILRAMDYQKRHDLAECFARMGIGRDILIYARK